MISIDRGVARNFFDRCEEQKVEVRNSEVLL